MTRAVTILGLGRMGSAMATRLVAEGWSVTGWSRSGRAVPGVTPRSSPTGSGLTLLSVHDAAACRDVLDRMSVSAGTVIVNTSTVAPEEAAELERRATARGAVYVHAPVIGSVAPARDGQLTLLAGGPHTDRVRPLLTTLGTVLDVGGTEEAATAKLIANGTLGASLLALRTALTAGFLGARPALVLDVLERTPLGGLVRAKRSALEGVPTGASFTVEALAKDLRLLGGLPGAGTSARRAVDDALASDAARPEDDVAALARPLPARDAPDIGLTVAADVTAGGEVLAPLYAYARGHATGDPRHFVEAFWPSARVEGLRDGALTSWDLDTYTRLFPGRPAADEDERRRHVDHAHAHGTVATAAMTLWHGPDVFTDAFVLLRQDGVWRVANKVYHRARAETPVAASP